MLVQDCFLTQHVSEPTRGDNILDLILSTQKEMIDNVRVVEPLGKSDHSQIQFNLRVKTVNKGTKQKRRDFKISQHCSGFLFLGAISIFCYAHIVSFHHRV